MEILKNFAVFEGCDGSGTTTQLNILKDFFQRNRDRLSLPPLYKTFEPTNGSIGKLIRSALRKEINLTPKTIAMLFAADRNEHIYGLGGIVDQCGRGKLVVSDRYVPSSLVYQGITCGEEFPARLNQDFPGPELLLFFDVNTETAQKRMARREHREIYEDQDFQTKVLDRYRTILPFFTDQGVRVQIIDASFPPADVAREVWSAIEKMPIFKR
jgi:dTMP kinase